MDCICTKPVTADSDLWNSQNNIIKGQKLHQTVNWVTLSLLETATVRCVYFDASFYQCHPLSLLGYGHAWTKAPKDHPSAHSFTHMGGHLAGSSVIPFDARDVQDASWPTFLPFLTSPKTSHCKHHEWFFLLGDFSCPVWKINTPPLWSSHKAFAFGAIL